MPGAGQASAPRVCILIINWNGSRDTVACLESTRTLDYANAWIAVLDNGSTDGSVGAIEAWAAAHGLRSTRYRSPLPAGALPPPIDTALVLLESDENLGFAGGCNAGIQVALAGPTEYVFLLNNDARVRPDSLSRLVAVSKESGAAIVGARLLDATGSRALFNGSRWPQRLFLTGRVDQIETSRPFWPSSDASGAAMLVRRDLIEQRIAQRGWLLDPGLFMYWEDLDLCLWARDRGQRCLIAREGAVTHVLGGSSGGAGNPRSLYYTTRNRVLMANRWLSPPWKILFHLYFIPSRLAILVARFRGWGSEATRAVLAGLVDGYRGRTGRWRQHGAAPQPPG